MRIIITNGLNRKTFDIINIFKRRKEYNQSLIITLETRNFIKKILAKILYKASVFILRQDCYKLFEKDLEKIVSFFPNEDLVYIPVEEKTTLYFYKFISKHNKHNLKSCLPKEDSFNIARNKAELYTFCYKNNLPVPARFYKSDIEKLKKDFVPLIVRPKTGSGARGIFYINSRDKLDNLLKINWEQYIIQKRIKNSKEIEGGFFLFKDGKLIDFYSHKRIRTYPKSGGVTVFSKLTNNLEIKEIGNNLLSKLKWSGFAMIEFLYDSESKEYKIIEVNPRLWGSILLSEIANTNFLHNYVRLSLGQEPVLTRKKEKAFIRWLFPWDILNFSAMKTKEFWNFFDKDTAYINITYSNFFSSSLFLLYNLFSFSTFKKFLNKLKRP